MEVTSLDPTIVVELRYASRDNFVGERLYPVGSRALLRGPVAERLARVQRRLRERDLGLKIFDAYRPHSVQKKLWEKFPVPGYVADPAKGSNHNRAAAVDVTLVTLEKAEVSMPSKYDEFTDRAHRDYAGGDPAALENRRILEEAMAAEGFVPLATEWWHFDEPDAKRFGILDEPL